MKDMRNKEVQVGDMVVFNHPECRVLDISYVINIEQDGVLVNYYTLEEDELETIIPEKQFVIIGADKENLYGA